MAVVRYVALVALVVWAAGMLPMVAGEAWRGPYVPFACGAVVLLSLVVLKFVGPPPRGFVPRTGIVAVMLAVALLAAAGRVPAAIAVPANLALAAILLFWYIDE